MSATSNPQQLVREARLEHKRVHAQTVHKEETHEGTASRLEHARIVRAEEHRLHMIYPLCTYIFPYMKRRFTPRMSYINFLSIIYTYTYVHNLRTDVPLMSGSPQL